jgi:hypothetical protein
LTLVLQHVLSPSAVTAQQDGANEVRASAFVLTGADGTVLGRLAPGPQGNGLLTLTNNTGRPRMFVSGGGVISVNDADGHTLVQVVVNTDRGVSGLFVRDAQGTARLAAIRNEPQDGQVVQVFDADGHPRVGLGSLADPSGAGSSDYGLRVRDADGGILTTVP